MALKRAILLIFIYFLTFFIGITPALCKELYLTIFPHIGYGNEKECYVEGIIYNCSSSGNKISYPNKIMLELSFDGIKQQVTSGDNGIFEGKFAINKDYKLNYGLNNPNYIEVSLPESNNTKDNKLVLVNYAGKIITNTTLEFKEPDAKSEYLVVSDIDDTVTQKSGTDLLSILTTNPNEIKARPGIIKVYNQLSEHNTMFLYVTGRPFYSTKTILEFFSNNNIPIGAIFSQNKGMLSCLMGTTKHKISSINKIISLYPEKKLILIGDNRFHDEQVYSKIAEQFPNNVLKIFIFKVNTNKKPLNKKITYIDNPDQILKELNFK